MSLSSVNKKLWDVLLINFVNGTFVPATRFHLSLCKITKSQFVKPEQAHPD